MTDFNFKSEFLRTLEERGFIYQVTDPEGLDKRCLVSERGGAPLTGYIGFDCTAESLHAGSLVQILMLRWLARFGGRPIALIGGGTTKIGDPSDKDKSRPILTQDLIDRNKEGIKRAFEPFLDFGQGPGKALMLDNDDWLGEIRLIDFLREIGVHFTINKMVALESVKRRLDREQPMTFLEFNYMLLQSYDYLELYRREGCTFQMGGSDQWGNIVNGTDLIRRKTAGEPHGEAFGLTTPLVTTSSGAKMGKTAEGAVWLNADKLSPYHYWQYWRDCADADVGPFLRKFTELPMEEIHRLEALQGAEINDAKKALASAATAMLHGPEAAREAEAAAAAAFSGSGGTEGLPSVSFTQVELAAGVPVPQACVAAGLAGSNGEVKRHIQAGAVRLNDQPVSSPLQTITSADLIQDGAAKLSIGKKKHALVRAS